MSESHMETPVWHLSYCMCHASSHCKHKSTVLKQTCQKNRKRNKKKDSHFRSFDFLSPFQPIKLDDDDDDDDDDA